MQGFCFFWLTFLFVLFYFCFACLFVWGFFCGFLMGWVFCSFFMGEGGGNYFRVHIHRRFKHVHHVTRDRHPGLGYWGSGVCGGFSGFFGGFCVCVFVYFPLKLLYFLHKFKHAYCIRKLMDHIMTIL